MDPQGDENYVSGASEVGKVAGRIANKAPRSVCDFWWTGRVFKDFQRGSWKTDAWSRWSWKPGPDNPDSRKHEYETKGLLQTFLAQIREDRDLFLSLSGPPAGCQALQAMQLVGAPVVWEARTTWQDFECLVEVDRIFAWYLPFTSISCARIPRIFLLWRKGCILCVSEPRRTRGQTIHQRGGTLEPKRMEGM